MIRKTLIDKVTKRLVKVYQPVAIYLFGSYSWGTPTPGSDLDILVVVDQSDEKSYTRPVVGHKALADLDVAKDIIVYTKAEFDTLATKKSSLAAKIKKEGSMIYARS